MSGNAGSDAGAATEMIDPATEPLFDPAVLKLVCRFLHPLTSPRNSLKSPLGSGRLSYMFQVTKRILIAGRSRGGGPGRGPKGSGSSMRMGRGARAA